MPDLEVKKMPFIEAANTAQVRIIQRLHSQDVSNTLYVRKNSPWGSADLTALANLVIDWWTTTFADNVSINLSLEGVAARDMSVEDGPGVEIAPSGPTTGGLPAQAAPGNVALVVKFLTGLTGRNRRGRCYVAGISELQAEGNLIAASARDAIVSSFGVLRDTLNSAGYTHVVASFYDGTALRTYPSGEVKKVPVPRDAALTTPIEQYRADVELDSMKRRLTNRGS